jgi:hypothetical protein
MGLILLKNDEDVPFSRFLFNRVAADARALGRDPAVWDQLEISFRRGGQCLDLRRIDRPLATEFVAGLSAILERCEVGGMYDIYGVGDFAAAFRRVIAFVRSECGPNGTTH